MRFIEKTDCKATCK